MIPYIQSLTFKIGPLTLQTWGVFVAVGFLVATWIAARRAKAKGLNPSMIWDMAFWIFTASIIGSRLFHAVFYEPQYYLAHPLQIINPMRPGFAIMGGLLAGALVVWLFAAKKGLNFLEYADVLVWGLPWGCGIGRIGCFLIHDHPGTLSSFALAIKYPDGQSRHDLGLYLSIVGFLIGIIFLIINRFSHSSLVIRYSRPGFWLGSFLIVDGIARFLLDFLRTVDRRIVGLTPTQWLLILTTGLGFWLVFGRKNKYSRNTEIRMTND
jgi:phosphatidylglycerol:prolipoprotein diacylglycerol transferase